MRQLKGIVISNKANKTAIIRVERVKKHPLYERRFKVSKKYKIHDERNECKEGQIVLFKSFRPISREKSYKLIKILEQK